MTTATPPDLHTFEHHWQDEADAAYLYRAAGRRRAGSEEEDVFADSPRSRIVTSRSGQGCCTSTATRPDRSVRPRARVSWRWLGKIFGPGFLLPHAAAEEGREVKGYLDMHRANAERRAGRRRGAAARARVGGARDELAGITGKSAEPWHRTGSGGFLRNVVYGFNDGLTANFGLVAGVIGATPRRSTGGDRRGRRGTHRRRTVDGIERIPRREERAGGLRPRDRDGARRDRAHARGGARRAGADLRGEGDGARVGARRSRRRSWPTRSECSTSRCRRSSGSASRTCRRCAKAWVTGLATAFGAVIPVFPFLFCRDTTAIVLVVRLAMASHFLVGAARSVFTGRSVFRSGPRHVRRRARRRGRRLLRRRLGREAVLARPANGLAAERCRK